MSQGHKDNSTGPQKAPSVDVAEFNEVILLADDEPDTLMLTTYSLQKAGFKVIQARNGREALEKALTERPLLAILDRMMPEMDGLEVCRQLRQSDPTMYIIMMTAMGTEDDRVIGWEAGADDYIVKPISYRELNVRVKAVLRRSRENWSKPSEVVLAAPLAETGLESVASPASSAPAAAELTERQRTLQALLLQAGQAAQANHNEQARQLYQQILQQDPTNELALKWLAYRTLDPYESCRYLEQLVKAYPDNLKARRLLEMGRRRCQELDQQSFGNILSYFNPALSGQTAPPVTGSAAPAPLNGSAPPPVTTPQPIGQLLIERGYITRENIETAASLQEVFRKAGSPRKLGEILLEYGLVTETQLQRVLEDQQKFR